MPWVVHTTRIIKPNVQLILSELVQQIYMARFNLAILMFSFLVFAISNQKVFVMWKMFVFNFYND